MPEKTEIVRVVERYLPLGLSIVGILIAVGSCAESRKQTETGRKIPFEAALYETRVSAMQNYARAHFELMHRFQTILSDMPYDIYSPEALDLTGDAGMQANAIEARKVMKAHEDYITQVNSIIGIWPPDIQNQAEYAAELASPPLACFVALGQKTLTGGPYTEAQRKFVWEQARANAKEPCRNLNDRQKMIEFQKAGMSALRLMQEQLRKTQNDLVPSGK